MTQHRIFQEIFKKILIHRAAARKSTALLRIGLGRQKAAASLIHVVATARRRERKSHSYHDKRKENAEWWTTFLPFFPPPSRSPHPATFLEIRLADMNELRSSRDRVCLRDRETLFPFVPLSARTIMVMHTGLCRWNTRIRCRKLRMANHYNWRTRDARG